MSVLSDCGTPAEVKSIYLTEGFKVLTVDGSDTSVEVHSRLIRAFNGDCNITAETQWGDNINDPITLKAGDKIEGCFRKVTLKSGSPGTLIVYEEG